MTADSGTPRSNRLHIGLFGRCNSGKSSLLNALCGQQVVVVSEHPGTTTDTVLKNVELPGLGACVIMDTAGFDDADPHLGAERVQQARRALDRVDVALLLVDASPAGMARLQADGFVYEQRWMSELKHRKRPILVVLTHIDLAENETQVRQIVAEALGQKVWPLCAHNGEGLASLRSALEKTIDAADEDFDLVGSLATSGDMVLLVMPQDAQAPRGRLILPQVQTIRCLLEKGCTPLCCTPEQMTSALRALVKAPALIITDSQVFAQVAANCPAESKLTSFSVLFARQKGDLQQYLAGAEVLLQLKPGARILIAEACSHIPVQEDIGRVKLPRLLRTRLHADLQIDIVSGADFPSDLRAYDLVIHCGGCMFTRRHVLNRLRVAREQHVPATNYGIAIAALTGILPRVVFPK